MFSDEVVGCDGSWTTPTEMGLLCGHGYKVCASQSEAVERGLDQYSCAHGAANGKVYLSEQSSKGNLQCSNTGQRATSVCAMTSSCA